MNAEAKHLFKTKLFYVSVISNTSVVHNIKPFKNLIVFIILLKRYICPISIEQIVEF